MTDKRFTFDNKSLLKDNEFWLDGSIATICNAKEICNKLNELSEENEWLKQSVKRQQSSNEECSKYIEEVQKENEQLKQENKGIQDKVWKLLELLEKEKGIDKRKIIDWWNGDVE